MPNHTLQILRLLRFAGLMLLLGSVASASAQTVAERMKNEPGFRIYPRHFRCHSHEQLETPSDSSNGGWGSKRVGED